MAKILVVDDDLQVCMVVRRILEGAGHVVEEASNGKLAFEALDEESYDLVVSDIYMPEMDGVEFLIRLHELHPGTRVVCVSGGGWRRKEGVLEDARALGAVRTLEKPFEADDLLSVVEDALQAEPEWPGPG